MHLKRMLQAALATLLVGSALSGFAADKPLSTNIKVSPIGYWKTLDETTGKPKSIVQVWKDQDQILMGKVVKIFPDTAVHQAKLCAACKGDQHNQPIVGMVIISGLKSTDTQWAHGRILDPENGRSYKCTVKLTENGKKLNVHGYTGFLLFGRSQTWERVDLMSG